MEITAIVKRKRQSRYDIYVDDAYVMTLSDEAILTHRLKVGKQVSTVDLAETLVEAERQEALSAVLSMLSSRALTTKEARGKLKDKGYSPDAIAYAIQRATEYGYLNDAQYAKDYIEYATQGKSKRRIQYELSLKGIDNSIVAPLLAGSSEEDACMHTIESRLRYKQLTDEAEAKLVRSLAQQGYPYETIRRCIARYKEEQDE